MFWTNHLYSAQKGNILKDKWSHVANHLIFSGHTVSHNKGNDMHMAKLVLIIYFLFFESFWWHDYMQQTYVFFDILQFAIASTKC